MPTVTVIQPKVANDTHRLLRVAAYCRVSSNSDDQLNSYNSQLAYYSHKFEGSETETLIDIYADEGITGTCEEKRTEFLLTAAPERDTFSESVQIPLFPDLRTGLSAGCPVRSRILKSPSPRITTVPTLPEKL